MKYPTYKPRFGNTPVLPHSLLDVCSLSAQGSTIAIDIAMPKVEEEGLMLDSGGLDGGGGMAVGRPSLNGNSPAGGVTFPHHGGGSSSGSMGQQPLGLQQQLDLLQRL